MTLTEQYTGLLLDQPSKLAELSKLRELIDPNPGAYVAQQTRLRECYRDTALGAVVRRMEEPG